MPQTLNQALEETNNHVIYANKQIRSQASSNKGKSADDKPPNSHFEPSPSLLEASLQR